MFCVRLGLQASSEEVALVMCCVSDMLHPGLCVVGFYFAGTPGGSRSSGEKGEAQ